MRRHIPHQETLYYVGDTYYVRRHLLGQETIITSGPEFEITGNTIYVLKD